MKWLHAGVMENAEIQEVESGSPQGSPISPLLANIFLHYAIDGWVHEWRKTQAQAQAQGEVYIVRYADDIVMGFQYERDARLMRDALAERLGRFGLELHPEKTRMFRFGRYAGERRFPLMRPRITHPWPEQRFMVQKSDRAESGHRAIGSS